MARVHAPRGDERQRRAIEAGRVDDDVGYADHRLEAEDLFRPVQEALGPVRFGRKVLEEPAELGRVPGQEVGRRQQRAHVFSHLAGPRFVDVGAQCGRAFGEVRDRPLHEQLPEDRRRARLSIRPRPVHVLLQAFEHAGRQLDAAVVGPAPPDGVDIVGRQRQRCDILRAGRRPERADLEDVLALLERDNVADLFEQEFPRDADAHRAHGDDGVGVVGIERLLDDPSTHQIGDIVGAEHQLVGEERQRCRGHVAGGRPGGGNRQQDGQEQSARRGVSSFRQLCAFQFSRRRGCRPAGA